MGIFLSQEKYSRDLLTRACSSKCKFSHLSGPFLEPSENCSLVRVPQYLTMIKTDLVYSVNTFCQHIHAPLVSHMQQIKRILRYVQELWHMLHILRDSTLNLYAYLDIHWVGYPLTFCSLTSFGVFIGSNLISWTAKKQPTVTRSSVKTEYRTIAAVTAELT